MTTSGNSTIGDLLTSDRVLGQSDHAIEGGGTGAGGNGHPTTVT